MRDICHQSQSRGAFTLKKLWLSLLMLVTIVACTNEQNPENTPNNEPHPSDEQHENDVTNENDPSDPTEDDNGPAVSFDMTEINRDDLEQGIITGLPFAMGAPFDEIGQQWGIPIEKDYMRGGEFHHYRVGDYHFYLFDPNADTITGIQINPLIEITFDQIRELLGPANFDELDDMLADAWSLTYHLDEYALFFIGQTESSNTNVHYMFLKAES